VFTGIVEEIGKVVKFVRLRQGALLTVRADKVCAGLSEGDSVNVDGTCLTVSSLNRIDFSAEISPETMRRSTLGACRIGKKVNLEKPVTPGGFMGGHIVQGHIDATAKVISFKRQGDHASLEVAIPGEQLDYIVPKGSITLNGVSLTVADICGENVSIALIPTTLQETNLGVCRRGDILNLEVDIIGKYVKSFVDNYRH